MKSVTVVALSVLTLSASVAGVEARGSRLRGFAQAASHGARPHAASVRSVRTVGAIGQSDGRTTAMNQEADEIAPIPPMPPAQTTVVGKPVERWCPSGRIAGAGTGFCLIN